MPFVPPQAALERPQRTVEAMAVLGEQAQVIARACADAGDSEVILAAVDPDLTFGGVWTIPVEQLSARATPDEAGGWSLLFSPGTSVEEIAARCQTRAPRRATTGDHATVGRPAGMSGNAGGLHEYARTGAVAGE